MNDLEEKVVQWTDREDKTVDPREYYKDHYEGITQTELYHRDRILYQVLGMRRWLDIVPKNKPKKSHQPKELEVERKNKQKTSRFSDPLKEYNARFPGKTSWEVEQVDPALARRLQRHKLTQYLPKANRDTLNKKLSEAGFENSPYGRDTWQYYQQHCAGYSRSRVAREHPGLYERLRVKGLLDQIPKKDHREVLLESRSPYGKDPLGYYHQNYSGITRKVLATSCPGLYERLRKEGLLNEVPLTDQKKVHQKLSPYGEDALAYYRTHHAGETRGEIALNKRGFYERLRKDKLLHKIPPTTE